MSPLVLKCALLIFTSDGVVKDRVALSSQDATVAEIPGGEWHSVVFHAPAAVVLEVKAGPYDPQLDKEFASWAPTEYDPSAGRFVTCWGPRLRGTSQSNDPRRSAACPPP
jgi:hypothetical protein